MCRANETVSNRFVGEESYSKGASKEYLITDEPTWCVDPLDGKYLLQCGSQRESH